MSLLRRPLLGLLLITAVLGLSTRVQAQGWLADRERAEGPGFRVGNLELHPGFGAEMGYDSNVFMEEADLDQSAILRLTAHLMLSTLGTERSEEGETRTETPAHRSISFRGGLSASYYHFFLDRAQDNVDGDLSLNLTINPDGAFQVLLHEEFARTVRPFVDAGTPDGPGPNFARNTNTAGVLFSLRSRSEILKGQLGYDLDYDFFEDDAFAYGNSLTHRVLGGMSWRFLPQTALVHETRLEFQSFTNTTAASSLVLNGIRVNSTIGLNGAFTNTFSASLVLGYGAGFFGAGNDEYESIIGRAEARWRPKQTLRFSLGYARRYAPSFVGSFYLSDRVYATSQILMGGAFMVGGEASLSYDRTGDALQPDGTLLGNAENREDLRINLEVFGEYRFTNWLGFNATLSYSGDVTNYEFNDMVVMGMSTVPDPGAAYHKFEAWLGARVYY